MVCFSPLSSRARAQTTTAIEGFIFCALRAKVKQSRLCQLEAASMFKRAFFVQQYTGCRTSELCEELCEGTAHPIARRETG